MHPPEKGKARLDIPYTLPLVKIRAKMYVQLISRSGNLLPHLSGHRNSNRTSYGTERIKEDHGAISMIIKHAYTNYSDSVSMKKSIKGRTKCRRLPALCGVWGRVVKPQALPTT